VGIQIIIAEYTLDHVILRETLENAPSTTVTWEESYTGPAGQRCFVAWIESDDFDAVDRGVRADPSVTSPVVLTELSDRRLYRLDLTEEVEGSDIMPRLMEVGGVHRELLATDDGWRNRTQFPDRAALRQIYRFCRDNDIPFELHRIWDCRGGDSTELTDAQREILLGAVESGYLDIPRRCSLAELGAELDISESAASERFRRGVKAIIRQTIQ